MMSIDPSLSTSVVVESIPFSKTGILPSLTLEYISGNQELVPFYNRHFSDKDFYSQILEKQLEFTAERRAILKNAIERQYREAGISIDESSTLHYHIQSLTSQNTFTVVTGHQLCIHTGPLYFLYKIISTLSMVKRLKKLYPDFHFVPVYWMASEDHDFDEINHFHHHQVRFLWIKESNGMPVGRLPLDDFYKLLETYSDFLKPHNTATAEWIEILQSAYLDAPNLAVATRRLVHALLGECGVMVVDGDDPELKKSFRFILKDEILNQTSAKTVKSTSEQLGKLWFTQVNPREINFFYLSESGRVRIVKDKDTAYSAGNVRWSATELEHEIELYPERFSPNVVTRPLYQEFVLPNLAYVGGANELAYWLQLKEMFVAHQVPMPILLLRNSFVMLDQKTLKFFEKNNLSLNNLFVSPRTVLKNIVKRSSATEGQFEFFAEEIENLYEKIASYVASVDFSLQAATQAQKVRHLKGLEKLKNKVLNAEIRKNAWLAEKLESINQKVFPGGVLQERYENAGQYYSRYGKAWIKMLIDIAEMPSNEVKVVFLPD
ncbi:putative cysteine ligase BshC [Thermaurantimonas aggregans]|uniref:Putative cysteine ligase BshC n=1 Tax=Thermaurantimonas aggregans TaxID=2173829 RepID=A0A401XNG6_9FLAO|nr:bacillithiol biosynthesis cysteine-adding enzyme BshC [Thermaurantimonas aggregans]MCX8148433.1 bacillithiol biosynthesis cysteine-adding enzyme BshC [Thermaurantimonas aggregans]GCD78568.1 putative cysteine ligase BshC [Thermaurantimonas aggregans]